jgi:rhodanese-related sulfurtransferase
MNLLSLIPTPPPLKAQSRVYELKARLDWGDPALTIVDVRDRAQFNISHITGAIPMPPHELVDRALSCLELTRDIYVYSDTDEEAIDAAAKLRAAGYLNISWVKGGLPAWQAMGYPIDAVFGAIAF